MKIVFLAEIKEKEKLEFLNHSSKLRKYLRNVLNLYSFAKRQGKRGISWIRQGIRMPKRGLSPSCSKGGKTQTQKIMFKKFKEEK